MDNACLHARLLQSCLTLCDPSQAPLSVRFLRQEYWNGLPFPSPGDLPNPGIKPSSPALQVDYLTTEPQGKLISYYSHVQTLTSKYVLISYTFLSFVSLHKSNGVILIIKITHSIFS